MGNALIVMVVHEEQLALNGLCIRDCETGTAVPVKPAFRAGYEATLAKNPDASWLLEVPASAVWLLPEEPHEKHGRAWHWKPRVLAAHRATVRRSHESFLNRHLADLDGMARSGWWIIEKIRVRVSEILEVPHRAEEKKP